MDLNPTAGPRTPRRVRRFRIDHAHPQIAHSSRACATGAILESRRSRRLAGSAVLDRGSRLRALNPLLQTFARHSHRLRWEQSYRKQDGLVPDAMLDGYGFAEIIGLRDLCQRPYSCRHRDLGAISTIRSTSTRLKKSTYCWRVRPSSVSTATQRKPGAPAMSSLSSRTVAMAFVPARSLVVFTCGRLAICARLQISIELRIWLWKMRHSR